MAPQVTRQNASQWQKVLQDHGKSMDDIEKSFMSKPTFNKWMKGNNKTKMEDHNAAIIQSFIGRHGMGAAKADGDRDGN